MDKIPFSVYDFFGYLSTGFILLVGLAAAFAGTESWQHTPEAVVGILLVVIAYISGHVVANVSGYLIEGRLVRDVLGTPTRVLFATTQSAWAKLLPGYYRPLPERQREQVLARASLAGIHGPGESLFYHCFNAAKHDDATMARPRGQEIVSRHVNGSEQQVEVGVHRGPLRSAMLQSTADFDPARAH